VTVRLGRVIPRCLPSRRELLRLLAGGTALGPAAAFAADPAAYDQDPRSTAWVPARRGRGTFALDAHVLRFTAPGIQSRFTVALIADTHLFRDDARGLPFREYSARMAKAYHQTKHFQTGEATDPERGLVEALQRARAAKAEWAILAGDILSFPSEAGVEWTLQTLAEAGIPHGYTAGNHDWHYEGLPGPLDALRQTWIERRLLPLYAGRDPMMWSHDLHGVRFVAIDNSTYEITPAQHRFFRAQVRTGKPLVLIVHIPTPIGTTSWNVDRVGRPPGIRAPRWPSTGTSSPRPISSAFAPVTSIAPRST
jgi:hypothetical protein